jgi:hypothetical protein
MDEGGRPPQRSEPGIGDHEAILPTSTVAFGGSTPSC